MSEQHAHDCSLHTCWRPEHPQGCCAPETELIEHLAARQWDRMTRSTTTYNELNESDKRACRALVTPVLADIRAWDRCPEPGCISVRGHRGRHPIMRLPERDYDDPIDEYKQANQ